MKRVCETSHAKKLGTQVSFFFSLGCTARMEPTPRSGRPAKQAYPLSKFTNQDDVASSGQLSVSHNPSLTSSVGGEGTVLFPQHLVPSINTPSPNTSRNDASYKQQPSSRSSSAEHTYQSVFAEFVRISELKINDILGQSIVRTTHSKPLLTDIQGRRRRARGSVAFRRRSALRSGTGVARISRQAPAALPD
jgi:hypothetical protein